MPLTPIHFSFNIIIYYVISTITPVEFLLIPCIFLLLAEIIDIDHLFSKSAYRERRNPFKTRYLHKHWKFIIILAVLATPFYPALFFGIGLMSHLLLDYTYTKYWLKMKMSS